MIIQKRLKIKNDIVWLKRFFKCFKIETKTRNIVENEETTSPMDQRKAKKAMIHEQAD